MKTDQHSHFPSLLQTAALVAALANTPLVRAQHQLSPYAIFVQAGGGDQAREASGGLVWNWKLARPVGPGVLTGYWEASLSRWSYSGVHETNRPTWLSQIGATPVLRYSPNAGSARWFAEAGIGLTLMSRIYRTDEKRFSTRFNFGDHMAVGRAFGEAREHELALRFEHFSNGGIRHPNPGENFVQIRYSLHIR